jgi:CRP/FNR family transcriptional regulator
MNQKNPICRECENGCPFSKLLSENETNSLLQRLTNVQYRKKEMLFKQNSYHTSLYYLKSGFIKIFTERRNEKNIFLKIISSNEIVNLISFFSNVFEYSAVALSNCEVCIVPIEDIRKSFLKNNNFTRYLFEEQSKLNSFMLQRLVSMGTKQMHGRLADVILYLCSSEFENTDIFEYLSRKDIAEMAGMSIEGSIRLLTEFKNDSLIRQEGKKLIINNMELMLRLSEVG